MSIFQVFRKPGLIHDQRIRLINFTSGEEGLGVLPVDHVTVHIHIVEPIIGSQVLRLIVELLRRLKVVNADIGNGAHVVDDIFFCERIRCGEFLGHDILQVIGILGIGDVVLQVRIFLVDFIRRNYEVLNRHCCAASGNGEDDHNQGHRQHHLGFSLLESHDKSNGRHHRQRNQRSVYPEGNVDIRKTGSVHHSGA